MSGTARQAIVAYIGLGSNLGDRWENLRVALDCLKETKDLILESVSPVYESGSVGTGGQGDFLNAVARVRTELAALALLRRLQEIEQAMGRPAPPRYGPRRIDLDLLLYGEERIATLELTVPHPRMAFRHFVLRPLCDVMIGPGYAQAVGTLPGLALCPQEKV